MSQNYENHESIHEGTVEFVQVGFPLPAYLTRKLRLIIS